MHYIARALSNTMCTSVRGKGPQIHYVAKTYSMSPRSKRPTVSHYVLRSKRPTVWQYILRSKRPSVWHYVARAWRLDAFSLTHHRRARSAHACASLQCEADDHADADADTDADADADVDTDAVKS